MAKQLDSQAKVPPAAVTTRVYGTWLIHAIRYLLICWSKALYSFQSEQRLKPGTDGESMRIDSRLKCVVTAGNKVGGGSEAASK